MAAGTAQAQPKIAVIDLPKVFNLYYKTIQADASLKDRGAEFEKTKRELIDQYAKVRKEYEQLLSDANDPAVSASEQAKRKSHAAARLRELQSMDERFTVFVRDTQNAVTEQIERTREKHLREIREKIKAKATAEGYALVVNTAALGVDRLPVVVYTNQEHDFTDEILAQLNANAPVPPAPGTRSQGKPPGDRPANPLARRTANSLLRRPAKVVTCAYGESSSPMDSLLCPGVDRRPEPAGGR